MLSDAIQADAFSTKNMEMKSDLSSCLFPYQPLAQQHLSLSRMRDFISLVSSYPMKIADKGMLKDWINDVYLAQSCSKTQEEEQCLCAKNPLRYVEGLVPDDILHKVRHGLRPIFNVNEPRTPKELSASASSGRLAELTDGIDVIPQAIVNLAIDLAVEQLIQTLLSSNHIHHVRLSTRNKAEKRIVMEKIESALKKEDNMLGIGSAFQRILHIDTSKYLSDEVVQVQLEIAKQMQLMKAIEDDTKYEHVFLKKHIEEEMMHKNHLVLLGDRDGDTKLDPKKLGFPKTGIAGTVVLITTESSTQENDELRREMDLEIMTEDHLLPWELFLRLVGGDLICSPGVIQNIAVQIVMECGGHLLAIAIVAKLLKDVEDVKFWESALDQLRSEDSSCDRQGAYPINSSPRVMFNAFKNFFWDNLEMTEKHCLTRCLFIPDVKDGKLEHQLMNDWVLSLLVESEEEAQDNLTEFVDCFILLQFEENGGKYIRLPPETFDVLQSLHTLNPSFIVQDGKGLTEAPNTEVWHEVVKIQLADNKLSEIPPSPNCLELKVLMLQGNPDLTEMPLDFFIHMPLLRILDLSYTSVKDLPTSFFDMEQLRELYLKGCQRFMKLPREVGKLKKLEKLDLDETQIIHLPEEIQNLSNLYSLTLCFYEYHGKKGMQYSCKTIIPSGVISKLVKLKHLSIDVHPDDERWHDNLRVILSEIVGLECLQTLSLYIPQAELLKLIPAHIFELDFRFVVGLHMKRIISGTIPTYEAKFKQSECSLKFVKGREVPYEIKKLLAFSKGFFLDRHMTINSLSEFEMENLEQLRFCILAECKEMQTIVDGRSSNSSKDILPHLLYLSVSYMKNLKNIWQGPAPFPFAFGMLKSLSLHACPKLTTIFTLDFLRNMSLLKELIVNDCPKVSSLISPESSEVKSQIFLPRLRKVFLLYLPELISISNGLHIGPGLETIVCYDCPRLQRLSNMELSSENLMAIKGETNWWEALKWSEVEWGKAGRPSKFNTIFSSINEESDIVSQLGMYNNEEIDDDSVSESCQVSTEISIVTKDTYDNYDNSNLAVDAPSQSKGTKEFRAPRLRSQVQLAPVQIGALLASSYIQTQPQPSSAVSAAPANSSGSCITQAKIPSSMPDPGAVMKESPDYSHSQQRLQSSSTNVDKAADDGYNWRKYGQKYVKGSEFPRIYYKRTHPNCPVKKKVERSLEGHVTEIIYKGQHNHQPPPPDVSARESVASNENSNMQGNPDSAYQGQLGSLSRPEEGIASHSMPKMDPEFSQAAAECLSGTSDSEEVADHETEVDTSDSEGVGDHETEVDEESYEPDPTRRSTEVVAFDATSVTEPRFSFMTRSEVDILDDGYRWRKYGQKVVKGSPYPRSYYKCATLGCNVRKHVERSSTDPTAVITTYEGTHNHHHVLAAKTSSHSVANNSTSHLKPHGAMSDNHTLNSRDFGSNEQQPVAHLRLKEEQIAEIRDFGSNELLAPWLKRDEF